MLRGYLFGFGKRLIGRNRSRQRNGKHGCVLRHAMFARRLRCEPLEDRRMLSIITVDSLDDAPVNHADGNTTLRDAIALAADEASYPGADEIRFDASLGLDTTPGKIALGEGQLTISSNVTITGPGAELLAIDANHASRVFYTYGSETGVELSGLTITGGSTRYDAGIYNSGTLTLKGSTISGNSATGESSMGGGINNRGTLTKTKSTISSNTDSNDGGMYN